MWPRYHCKFAMLPSSCGTLTAYLAGLASCILARLGVSKLIVTDGLLDVVRLASANVLANAQRDVPLDLKAGVVSHALTHLHVQYVLQRYACYSRSSIGIDLKTLTKP